MEIQTPRSGSVAPPPGTGERGFDKLQNPGGVALVAILIILFTWLCYFGSRWVRQVSKGDAEKRRKMGEELKQIAGTRAQEEKRLP